MEDWLDNIQRVFSALIQSKQTLTVNDWSQAVTLLSSLHVSSVIVLKMAVARILESQAPA